MSYCMCGGCERCQPFAGPDLDEAEEAREDREDAEEMAAAYPANEDELLLVLAGAEISATWRRV